MVDRDELRADERLADRVSDRYCVGEGDFVGLSDCVCEGVPLVEETDPVSCFETLGDAEALVSEIKIEGVILEESDSVSVIDFVGVGGSFTGIFENVREFVSEPVDDRVTDEEELLL